MDLLDDDRENKRMIERVEEEPEKNVEEEVYWRRE